MSMGIPPFSTLSASLALGISPLQGELIRRTTVTEVLRIGLPSGGAVAVRRLRWVSRRKQFKFLRLRQFEHLAVLKKLAVLQRLFPQQIATGAQVFRYGQTAESE